MFQTLRNKTKRITTSLAAGVLLFSQFAVVPAVSADSPNWPTTDPDKISICHASSAIANPYQAITVNKSAADGIAGNSGQQPDHFGEHNDPLYVPSMQQGDDWGDIIPPIAGVHQGLNWPSGEDIYNNGCVPAAKGSIKIVKDASPDAAVLFGFNINQEGEGLYQNFTLEDDGDNADGNLNSKTFTDLPGDEYVVTEIDEAGWDLKNIVCTGASYNKDVHHEKVTINLGPGHNAVCTFTNEPEYGSITIEKDAVPNSTDDFSFTASTPDNGNFTLDNDLGVPGGNNQYYSTKTFDDLVPGTPYTFTELEAEGWYLYSVSCKEGGDNVAFQQNGSSITVTLTSGQDVNCKFTNKKAGTLRVVKDVVNNHGGGKKYTDFSFTVGGQTYAFNQKDGDLYDGVKELSLKPGTYSVVEPEANTMGYATSYSNCEDVVVTAGETATCIITNDDIAPLLTVNKNVINDDNGGTPVSPSAFPLFVGGQSVLSGIQTAFSAGTYTITEQQQPGFVLSGLGGACNFDENENIVITLVLGGVYTCNLTNDDQPATITVTKEVVNNNGGEAQVGDFKLYVGDEEVVSGASYEFPGNVDYTIGEDGPDGYEQTSLTCVDTTAQASVENPFKAELGHNYECTIVNDDEAPSLKIKKWTLPFHSEEEFDFSSEELDDTFSLGGGDHKNFDNLHTGTYTVTEDATNGWYLKNIYCWGATDFSKDLEAGSVTVTLGLGDEATCKFLNAEYGSVSGFKFEDVNGNGHFDEDEPKLEGWTITIEKLCKEQNNDEVQVESFSFEGEGYECESFEDSTVTDEKGNYSFDGLKPGLYKVCEVQQDGWVQTKPNTEDGCKKVWVWFGSDKFVKFGNFELGKVTGVKFNDANGNGKRDEGEPTLKNWEITITNKCEEVVADFRTEEVELDCEEETLTTKTDENGAYSFIGLLPGKYTVCEVQQTNWTQTFPQDNNGCHEVTIEGETSGEVVTADFGNKAKPQVLGETTTKQLVNTGTGISKNLGLGLTILSVLGAVHFLSRRKNYAN